MLQVLSAPTGFFFSGHWSYEYPLGFVSGRGSHITDESYFHRSRITSAASPSLSRLKLVDIHQYGARSLDIFFLSLIIRFYFLRLKIRSQYLLPFPPLLDPQPLTLSIFFSKNKQEYNAMISKPHFPLTNCVNYTFTRFLPLSTHRTPSKIVFRNDAPANGVQFHNSISLIYIM